MNNINNTTEKSNTFLLLEERKKTNLTKLPTKSKPPKEPVALSNEFYSVNRILQNTKSNKIPYLFEEGFSPEKIIDSIAKRIEEKHNRNFNKNIEGNALFLKSINNSYSDILISFPLFKTATEFDTFELLLQYIGDSKEIRWSRESTNLLGEDILKDIKYQDHKTFTITQEDKEIKISDSVIALNVMKQEPVFIKFSSFLQTAFSWRTRHRIKKGRLSHEMYRNTSTAILRSLVKISYSLYPLYYKDVDKKTKKTTIKLELQKLFIIYFFTKDKDGNFKLTNIPYKNINIRDFSIERKNIDTNNLYLYIVPHEIIQEKNKKNFIIKHKNFLEVIDSITPEKTNENKRLSIRLLVDFLYSRAHDYLSHAEKNKDRIPTISYDVDFFIKLLRINRKWIKKGERTKILKHIHSILEYAVKMELIKNYSFKKDTFYIILNLEKFNPNFKTSQEAHKKEKE